MYNVSSSSRPFSGGCVMLSKREEITIRPLEHPIESSAVITKICILIAKVTKGA